MNQTEPTAEEQVKAVWPDAVKQVHGTLCYIQNGMDGDALGFSLHSFEDAWQNALNNIKTPDTMSPVEEELLNKAIENNSKKTPSKDYRK